MKRLLMWVAPVAAFVAVAPGAMAQGGFQPSPEMQAKMKAWQKFRETHKNYEALTKAMIGIGDCEKDPKTALNKAQASKVLAVFRKWEKKPFLSNEEAGAVNKELTAGLSNSQIKKVALAEVPGRGGRGFGGGARPGGGGGPGGGRPGGGGGFANFKFPDPKEYNPFNPDTMPFEQARPRMRQRLAEFKAQLSAAK